MSTWVEPSGHIFRVHQRSLPAFQDAAARIRAAGTGYRVTSGAGFVWRNLSGSRQMSHHAVGNTVDVNPSANPHTDGRLITNMPAAYVAAWRGAGFCWGGDWVFTKDTMHFSWRGPAVVGGRSPRLAPYPPLTGAAGFTQRALQSPVAIPAGAKLWAMSDRRRDGADDLYGVVEAGGVWQVQVSGAVSRFATTGVRRTSGAPTGGILALADANGDGRADLWRFDNTVSTIRADVYFDSTRFRKRGLTVDTGVSWSPDAEIGLAVFDWDDWLPDLFVIRRSTGVVEVYSSSSGYRQLVHISVLPVPVGDASIVLADRDVDGYPDLWLVSPGNPAKVSIVAFRSATGYSGSVETPSTTMPVPAGASVLPGDWDGDGRIDLYVVAAGSVSVWLGGVPDRPINTMAGWFTPDGPMTFDAGPLCLGACDSIGYVDPGGVWRLAHRLEWAPEERSFYYGNPDDYPFLGDWNCDGVDTPGLYRRSDGYVYLRNSNTEGVADVRFFFGNPGDIALPGDFNGDGCDTLSLYRPSESRVYVINRLGSDDAGLGAADFSFMFGNPGDKPFVGDFDGNGVDEVGLHRESTGRVYFRFSLTTGIADRDFFYGNPGDFLVAGDWNGDGVDTPAIYRPSEGLWYVRLSNTQGIADHVVPFGAGRRSFLPVAGRTVLGEGGLSTLSETPPESSEHDGPAGD